MMKHLSRIPALLLALAITARADEEGHSKHGEAFNEGPRQAAVLMEGMPKIDFPITTKSPEAQKFFTQGVAQQHGFWYFEAERSHRQAAALDPEAPMPYWGMALANINNEKRAKAFIAKAVALKDKASEREKLWIGTLENFYKEDKRDKKQRQLDYIKDLENLVQEYPKDIEAKAFLAWKIWDARSDAPISSLQAVDALLDQVFAASPMHPAHHYRIHLWDQDKPKRAVASGALCGQTSPGIAHMWHMPGHTYSKLTRFDDAAWQQEASTRVDHAYMMRSLVLPDRIHNYAHNEEWLIRTWNEQGRAHDGIALAKALIENPRHPELNTLDKQSTSASYGRTRLLETLVKWDMWTDLLQLNSSPFLQPAIQTGHEAARLRALGLAHFETGDTKALAADITALEALEKKAITDAKKPEPKKDEGKEEIRKAEQPKAANGKKPEAKVADTKKPEEKKDGNGKKPEDKKNPATDALAELRAVKLILSKAKNAEVIAALEKAKDTPKTRLARYYLRIGEKDKASEAAKAAPQDIEGSLVQAEVYHASGKDDEAKKAFERLRDRAYAMDKDLPVIKRIEALASAFKIADWRKPAPVRTDSGVRPTLDSLGPVHWTPPAAPAWDGKRPDGTVVSSKDYAGKNTLLIFYVGHSCSHCMEQLRAFAPLNDDFKKAGIEILALSPDSPEDAPKANKSAADKKKGFPFQLISAEKISTFQGYRAYDDFEKFPLHGVALVDARGRLRWLDVTYTPFMDVKFLLEESRRLLGLPDLKPVAAR